MDQQNFHVFISYRREKGFSTAIMIRDRLEQKGLRCFLDLKVLRSGTFDTEILTSIKNTRNFILVLHPTALDSCPIPGDWMTREILAAMDSGCNIIPLLCDGFSWPDEWDPQIPQALWELSRYNSVFLSQHYLDATVDRLVEFMKDLPFEVTKPEAPSPFRGEDVKVIFENFLRRGGLTGLDIALHAGAAWHSSDSAQKIITDIADLGIPIRVLINTPQAAWAVAQHMRRRKRYVSFDDAIGDWEDFASEHPNVQVRVCDIPLLRAYYSFYTEPGSQDLIWLKHYIYGSFKIAKDDVQVFFDTSDHFKLYREEFEFLWNNAQ